MGVLLGDKVFALAFTAASAMVVVGVAAAAAMTDIPPGDRGMALAFAATAAAGAAFCRRRGRSLRHCRHGLERVGSD